MLRTDGLSVRQIFHLSCIWRHKAKFTHRRRAIKFSLHKINHRFICKLHIRLMLMCYHGIRNTTRYISNHRIVYTQNAFDLRAENDKNSLV